MKRCKVCRRLTSRRCPRCQQPSCWSCATSHNWPDGIPCVRHRSFGVRPTRPEPEWARPDLWPPERLTRFWAFVASGPDDACWPWTGRRLPAGQGRYTFRHDGRIVEVYAHRIVYILEHGPIPPNHQVFNRCTEYRCCNPAHLVAGPLSRRTQFQGVRAAAGAHHYNARLTDRKVEQIRALATTLSPRALAERFGLSVTHVRAVVRRDFWR